MASHLFVASALAGALALAACTSSTNTTAAAKSDQAQTAAGEQCFGVANAGHNDCKAAGHDCAGHATADRAGTDFVLVPAGTCGKLVGGSLSPKA